MEKGSNGIIELRNCYHVRAILMMLIVLYHSIVFWSSPDWFIFVPLCDSKILSVLANVLNSFHIYTFVLVSGYVYYAIRFEKKRYSQFMPFAIGKVKRLILPYYMTLIVLVIPHYLLWHGPDVNTIVKNYILGKAPDQLWFLLMLFWVYLLFYAFSELAKHHIWITIPTLLLIYALSLIIPLPNYFQIKISLRYVIYFAIGFYIREFDLLRLIRDSKAWIRTGIMGGYFLSCS